MQEKNREIPSTHYHHIDTELAFRSFFVSSPLMMGIADIEGEDIRHIADNEAAARFFHLPASSLAGKLSSELGISSEQIHFWLKHYRQAARTGKAVSFEYQHFTGERSKILSVTVTSMGVTSDGHQRFSYIIQDNTDLRRDETSTQDMLQEALRSSELRYKTVVENMSEGLVLFDAEKNLIYQNPAALKIHGYNNIDQGKVENHKLKSTWEAWFLDDRKVSFDEWPVSKVFRGERFSHQVMRVRRSEDGYEFYGSYNGCPIYDDKGKLMMGFITIRDLSDEIRNQQLLQESEGKFREIANALPLIIWAARPDGFVYWYNDWYYSYTGLTKDQDRWDEEGISPIHPDDLPQLVARWTYSLQTGMPTNIEFRVRRASDGMYRWHLSRGIPIRNPQGEIIKWVGSNTDIHDTKILLEQLELAHTTREQFVAALSHDLRTPLTAAKMSAQLITRKPFDIDVVNRSSNRIIDNMNRADSMIRDLLDVSRVRAGEKLTVEVADCHLNRIIHDTIDDLTTLYGDRFQFIFQQDVKGQWSCSGIRRMLENLCTNAVKYGAAHAPVRIILERQDDWVSLCVHNEGSPISESDQLALFEPFQRVGTAISSGKRGWGLGLTLVRGLAEAHGGNVRVESSGEKGTSFIIKLPMNKSLSA